jgi:hypothetical protein
MSLASDIRAARDVWLGFGHFKGGLHDLAGLGHCAIAAAEQATAIGLEDDKIRYAHVVQALNDEVRILQLPFGGIVAMNDHPETTFKMMMFVFLSAAARAERAALEPSLRGELAPV